ncbi:MAG: hypothetical protein EHM46_01150 [Bacteroidetes bacterium]|nr:MAG: hypothetical protein EHM46_01150 [Bacteroidota bacterium]
MKPRLFTMLPLAVMLFFAGCHKDDPIQPEGNVVYDVSYTENTVFIDSLEVQSLLRIDTADYVYYFDSSSPDIAGLEVNDILLIYGVALRRVTGITESGGETRVETAYARLNDAISDGRISWDREIKFTDGVIPDVQMHGKSVGLKSVTSDGFEFEFSYGEFSYRIKFDFTDEKADVEFEISKDLAGPVTARFLTHGSIESFHSSTEMVFEGGKLTQFGQKNPGMQGELTLKLTVAGSGRDLVTFDFPVVLLKYPVMVGPIPVTINVKVLFVINCSVPVDGSSQVEAKFTYNSTAGIKYNGISVSADASVGDQGMEKNLAQTGASSAIAANFGLAFPRLEIGVFDQVIVPWIQTAFLIGGDYTFQPACQQAKSQFIAACGLDLSFLGFNYSANTTLWQEEKVLLKSGECP